MSKPDINELVSIALINNNMDLIDANFIPAAMMRATVDQSIANNITTKAAYDAVAYDSYAARSEGAMVSLSNDEITIRKAGLYLVVLNTNFAAGATGVRRSHIAKTPPGASLTPNQNPSPAAGGSVSLPISEPMVCAVNDVISTNVFQTSGGALNLTNLGFTDGNFLAVVWLGNIA